MLTWRLSPLTERTASGVKIHARSERARFTSSLRDLADAVDSAAVSESRHSSADLFEVVWRELSEVIGTTATAMLLRRAARSAANGELESGLTIVREGFEHRYTVPETWHEHGGPARAAVECIFRELRSLLIELTGPVLIRRLAMIPIPDIARAFESKEVP